MKKRDIILISVILAVAIISLLAIKLMQGGGTADTDNSLSQGSSADEATKPEYNGYVVVSINGESIAEYSLSADGEYSINNGTNILKIENGEAWMIYADCPTMGSSKCTYQGKISKRGQMITCLPNKIVVMVKDGTPSDIDLIS